MEISGWMEEMLQIACKYEAGHQKCCKLQTKRRGWGFISGPIRWGGAATQNTAAYLYIYIYLFIYIYIYIYTYICKFYIHNCGIPPSELGSINDSMIWTSTISVKISFFLFSVNEQLCKDLTYKVTSQRNDGNWGNSFWEPATWKVVTNHRKMLNDPGATLGLVIKIGGKSTQLW